MQTQEYSHHKGLLNEIIIDEIQGHDIRTRCQPKFELNEPDISTYSKFEKMYQSQHMIHQLADEKNDILYVCHVFFERRSHRNTTKNYSSLQEQTLLSNRSYSRML